MTIPPRFMSALRAALGASLLAVLLGACQPPEDFAQLRNRDDTTILLYGTANVTKGEIRFAIAPGAQPRWKAHRPGREGEPVPVEACLRSGVCYQSIDSQLFRKEPGTDQLRMVLDWQSLQQSGKAREQASDLAPVNGSQADRSVAVLSNSSAEWIFWNGSEREPKLAVGTSDGNWSMLLSGPEFVEKRWPTHLFFLLLIPCSLLSLIVTFASNRKIAGRVFGLISGIPLGLALLLSALTFDQREASVVLPYVLFTWLALFLLAFGLGRRQDLP